MTTPVLEPRGEFPTVDALAPADPFWTASRIRAAALALVAVQLLVRGWLVAGRNYYWDDFTLLDLADRSHLLSPSFLFQDYDGQFMPGSLLLAGLVERAAPLQWWPAAGTLVGMQVLASLALLRLLRLLLGDRPVLLVPLAFGLFTPMTLGSSMWWAAALNSMPLQIGLAWFLADAVQLSRTGRRRFAVTGTLVLALTFCFYLKAVLVPWIGVAVVAIVLFRDGQRAPVAAAWRRARALWLGSLAVTCAWAVAYVATRDDGPVGGGLPEILATVRTGLRTLTPVALGGPFSWALFPPGAPIGNVPGWSVGAGVVVLLGACVWTVVHLRGASAVWALAVGTAVAGLVMAAVGRSGLGLGAALPLAYRYFAADSVVLAVGGALLASLPRRAAPADSTTHASGGTPPWAAPVVGGLTAVFVLLAAVSTLGNGRAWRNDPTGDYLDAARASLAAAGPAPLLDQSLPEDVMWGMNAPANLISHALAPLPDRPPFGIWTDDLRMLDDRGRLVPAHVAPGVRS